MESLNNALQYVTGPIQLAGLVIGVLAALVPRLVGTRMAQKNQRTLVIGLLVLGAIAIVGGISLEARGNATAGNVSRNVLSGDGNAVGINNSTGALGQGGRADGHVTDNSIDGNQNAVGIGNATRRPSATAP